MGGRLLPRRPGLNGYTEEDDPFSSHRVGYDSRLQTKEPLALKTEHQGPKDAVVLEGYRNDMDNGFEGERPLYNPANTTRPQSSMHLNVNDPIQVHLLVETALGDSREYEILAPEEVDDLKKEIQALSQRIDQTRQNLVIQSKYRDAANSMAKLYSSPDGKKKNGIMHSRTDSVKEADLERIQSEKKCEALANELWSLEKKLMVPQNKLLKHTAGILQMTHKGPKNAPKGTTAQTGGIPGSPESIYTYHNARTSVEPISDEIVFDERSYYRTADRLDAFSDFSGRDSFGPPPKSQAREQMQMIAKTEQTLESLNKRLRDVIVKANPRRERTYSLPPLAKTNAQGRSTGPGETLQNHLEYMERSIQTIDQEHGLAAKYQQESERVAEERIEELNREVRGLLLPYDPYHPEPPVLTGTGLNQQLLYFQDSIGAVEMELSSAVKKGNKVTDGAEMEKMIMGLWDIILSGEQDIRRRKQERRVARATQGLSPDEDDSPDDSPDLVESFSLQAFSTKVQMLYTQATRLKDQKKVLQRQIKQQRELNSKSDATKDAEMQAKVEELERVKDLLTRTEADADRTREAHSKAIEELEGLQSSGASAAEHEAATQKIRYLEDQLQELQDDHKITSAEIQSQVAESETKIAGLTVQLKAAETAIKDKEQEVDRVKVEVARLQTEVTLARAELDGAYGSRAERAAEAAAMSPVATEQVQTLKKELEETITEYEAMTKASIEWEKERDKMEEAIDKLRDEKENLETQLNEEKVRCMGMKSPSTETPGNTSTSTMVLRNEFKKMMRDTRAENTKALRAEQAERRKLEDELRALKRLHGPGKSGLSQSVRTPS
ncbi:hypothetical protein OIDMADRAFT_158353 [Oidiodendron maius Zn]|uniref:Uncharacterized protein n=1 Tax=Oidiodendron maius (strain Zn) TaxID=913774 RepID=A0A0C3CXB8_OIDMZ|nr:hypothetical protein OIDMADRAFT_158353 [Oidiodendron maius Zn]